MATNAELLRCIFASEPTHVEIRERRDAILAIPAQDRTPVQVSALPHYQAQIAHDLDVIPVMMAQLPPSIRNNMTGLGAVAVRNAVLDALDNEEVSEVSSLTMYETAYEQVHTFLQSLTPLQRLLLSGGQYDNAIGFLQAYIADILARRAKRVIRRQRIAALRAQAQNTWGAP